MDFWAAVALCVIAWALVLTVVGYASKFWDARKAGVTMSYHQRAVDVSCDRCPTKARVVVISPGARQPSEARWDSLVVQKLHELGWSAGVEPIAHHQRIVPDVCPTCRKKPR